VQVDLNDEHDKAANDEATADLTRNRCVSVSKETWCQKRPTKNRCVSVSKETWCQKRPTK
jgi:hypothetical protein